MNIGIIGLGLIGGSLGRAIKQKTTHRVFAFDTDGEVMLGGSLLGAFDEILTEGTAREIDILAVAVYTEKIEAVLERYLPQLKENASVFDCGGNKRAVAASMKRLSLQYKNINFIAMHPMAGREYSGLKHSSPRLFEHSTVLAVPISADIEALSVVKRLFLDIGCEGMVVTTAEEHDKNIAYTSQLAHVVSSAYVKNEIASAHYGFSAGSFRDMTRVARLNPEMWTALMLENKDNLLKSMDIFINNILEYKKVLENGDAAALNALLAEGNEIKTEIERKRKQKLADRID